jgi:hypothetical protein
MAAVKRAPTPLALSLLPTTRRLEAGVPLATTTPGRPGTRGHVVRGSLLTPSCPPRRCCSPGRCYLKWVDGTARDAEVASVQSVHAAVDATVAMLSYRPDTVEQNLLAARDRMTGAFRDSYTSLTHDGVIPGAKQRQISAVTTVPAAASVTATSTHAVVLVFVNQTTVVGNDPPSDTASTVKVTLERLGDRWLISQFDPVWAR